MDIPQMKALSYDDLRALYRQYLFSLHLKRSSPLARHDNRWFVKPTLDG